jgi:hypothetical protein
MKSTLIDISKKIDKSYVDVIRELNKATDLLSIPFFIIGAMARDFIMDAGIFNRLYESELRLMEEENFDNRMAAIKLLGKDMKALCNKNTLGQIRGILDEETDEGSNFNLVLQMMHANMQYNFENILNLLKKLKEGIKD